MDAELPLRTINWAAFFGSWFFLTMGVIGTLRGTLGVLGVGDLCFGRPQAFQLEGCPPVSHGSIAVGLVLITAGALLGVYVAGGFGIPAHRYAAAAFFAGQGAAFLIAAFRVAGGISIPLLVGGLLCVAAAILAHLKLGPGRSAPFFGLRRLDGHSASAAGLPVRDALAIGVAWVLSIGAGLVFALALS